MVPLVHPLFRFPASMGIRFGGFLSGLGLRNSTEATRGFWEVICFGESFSGSSARFWEVFPRGFSG